MAGEYIIDNEETGERVSSVHGTRARTSASQEWSHRSLKSVGVLKADDLLAKNSVPVVKQRGRQPLDSTKLLFQPIGCHSQRVTNSNLLRKLDWVFKVRHGVELKSDDCKSPRTIAVQEPLVAWHLFLAWLAPGGPKINQHNLTLKVV